jgi:hypothetical protein
MAEPMTVWVEVWPVAADEVGIWLLSGDDAWRPDLPVMADNEPHADVELLLAEHDALDAAALLHSTSWRVDGPRVILTYMAVIRCPTLVREHWPTARPISIRVARAVGRPPTHAPVEPPAPRYIDVLMHGLRHLRFLLDTDATAAAALDEAWRQHLASFEPALTSMYDQLHQPTYPADEFRGASH